MAGDLVRVVAPYFVAGFEIEGDKVLWCAPILRKHVFKWGTRQEISAHLKRCGWRASIIARFEGQPEIVGR